MSAFVAASQAAPQLVYPYGLGYSHAITHAVPTTVKKVNIETKEIKFELKVFNYDSTKEYQIKEKQNLYKEFSHTMCQEFYPSQLSSNLRAVHTYVVPTASINPVLTVYN